MFDASENASLASLKLISSRGCTATAENLAFGFRVTNHRVHSFDNWQPTALRLNRQHRRWTIVAVRLRNAVDQRVVERTERPLTDGAAERALAAFGQFGLWQQPSFAVTPDVLDGAMWIVEGRKGSAYHAFVRSNVAQEVLHELALTLFDVSGMNPW